MTVCESNRMPARNRGLWDQLTTAIRWSVALLVELLLVSDGAGYATAESWEGLSGLERVAVETAVEVEVPDASADHLTRHIEARIANATPRPMIDPTSPNRLRLRVTVRPISATTLRGFYLPFSGTYGVGSVRLILARRASVSGVPHAVDAVVWEEERLVAGPWRDTQNVLVRAVDELVSEFLTGYEASVRRTMNDRYLLSEALRSNVCYSSGQALRFPVSSVESISDGGKGDGRRLVRSAPRCREVCNRAPDE